MLKSRLGLRPKQAASQSNLCDICQTIDLAPANFIVRSGEDRTIFKKHYNLGILSDICRKTYCPLCRLVTQAAGGPDFAQNAEARAIKCQLYWQEEGFVYSKDEPQVRCLHLSAQPWPRLFNELNRLVFVPDRDRTSSSRPSLFFGRLLPQKQIDFDQIKMWLHLCMNWHGSDCDIVKLAKVEPLKNLPYFKVIDVRKGCVVDAPSDCRFCALSYVWGSVKTVELTKANGIDLAKPGSLLARSNPLPVTIQDAIEAVSRIGERYLWVDSLCIVQDDLATKNALIISMDQIYAQAFLTIIAAGGKDANAGLSGVRRNTRETPQVVEKVAAGVRLAYSQHLADSLDKAVYQSRAWTYQERLFSRRCLFFVNGHVVFRCLNSCWREDIFAESQQVSMSSDMTGINNFDSPDTADPHGDYVGCLYQFTRRNTTYDWDILNAFAGVSNFLEGRLNSKMQCGLPESLFDWSILWEPSQAIHRRSNLPSWSWAGWTGGLEMPGGGWSSKELQDWLLAHTWIVWYLRDSCGGEPVCFGPLRDDPKSENGSRSMTQHRKGNLGSLVRPESRFSFAAQTSPVSSPKPRHLKGDISKDRTAYPSYSFLQFWTVSAKYRISAKDIKHRLPVPGLALFGIYDSAGVLSGKIWLNEDLRDTIEEKDEVEFIVLSDAKNSDMTDQDYQNAFSTMESLNVDKNLHYEEIISTIGGLSRAEDRVRETEHDPSPIYDGVDLGPFGSNGRDASSWNLFNVMLVEWHDGIAERLGVGKLYRQALRHAFPPGPQWKEIILG